MSYTIISGTKFFYYNFIMLFYMLLNSFINIYDDVILSFYIKSTNTFMDIDRETYNNIKKNRFIKFIDFLIDDNVNTLSIDKDNILYTISDVNNSKEDDHLYKEDDINDEVDKIYEDEENNEDDEFDKTYEDEKDEDDQYEDDQYEDEKDEDDQYENDQYEDDNKTIMFKFDDIDYSYKKNKKQKLK